MQYFILARDLLEFNSAILRFTKAGVPKEKFVQIVCEDDLLPVIPGTTVFITEGAPGRDNYKDLVRGLKLRGAVPQAVYTPPHIKEMHMEYEKAKVSVVNDVVWRAVEDGVNPARMVIQQLHEYNEETNRLEVKVGLLELKDNQFH